MAMQSPKQAFLALRHEWARRLRESGFRDLENLLPNGRYGDLLASPFPTHYTADDFDRGYAYYAKARRFALYFDGFPSDLHREVWALYGEGLTYREIGKRVGRHNSRVQARLEQLMPAFLAWVDPADVEEVTR